MKRLLIFIVIGITLTACAYEKINKPTTIAATPVVQPNYEKFVPVQFKPVTLRSTDLSLADSASINKIVNEVQFGEATIVLYNKKNDEDQNFYAGIKIGDNDKIYEDKEVIGYGNPDDIDIYQVDLNGVALLKISGFIGANAPITHYIQIKNGIPTSFIKMEYGVQEYDVDNDGKKELVANIGGTLIETEIIKVTVNKFEAVNLNELMNGSVVFDEEKGKFIVSYGLDKNPELYQLTTKGMEYVSQLSF
jgi:hypothetical protein